MRFDYIPKVENYQFYLDVAFKRAKDKAVQKEFKGDYLTSAKRKEMYKLAVVRDVLTSRLDEIVKKFPRIDELPDFYKELVDLTLYVSEFKKSLAAVNWASSRAASFHSRYTRLINKCRELERIAKLRNEFYGRVSSILKQISINLQQLDEARRIIKEYPDLKSMFTVCVVGFPNVGKTTLLFKLTGSKPEIASYAFTTKGLNISYMEKNRIQVIDTPGNLNRLDKMNNIEKQAYLAIKHSNLIVYVFDLTEPYELEKQIKLHERIESENKDKNIIVYLSKSDILEKEKINEFGRKFELVVDIDELKENIFGEWRRLQ